MAATRSLVTTTTTAWWASTLRRRPGAGMLPAARRQFFHAIHTRQTGIAVRDLYDVGYARDLLKRAKKQEQMMRRGIKWFSRGAKVVEWACYFCVSVTIAAAVTLSREEN